MRSWVPAPWIGRVPGRPFWIGQRGRGGGRQGPAFRPARRGSLDGRPPFPEARWERTDRRPSRRACMPSAEERGYARPRVRGDMGVEGKGARVGPPCCGGKTSLASRERWIARFVSWKVYREGGLPRPAASQVVIKQARLRCRAQPDAPRQSPSPRRRPSHKILRSRSGPFRSPWHPPTRVASTARHRPLRA